MVSSPNFSGHVAASRSCTPVIKKKLFSNRTVVTDVTSVGNQRSTLGKLQLCEPMASAAIFNDFFVCFPVVVSVFLCVNSRVENYQDGVSLISS
jgi:hypothetical protein